MSINVTMIWYLIAIMGELPAKIKPVIIPGKVTIPSVLAESIVGIIPVRIASRTIGKEAPKYNTQQPIAPPHARR